MNKFLNFFTAILFLSTAILMSCGPGGDDTTGVDPVVELQNAQGAILATGTATASSITVDGVPNEAWAAFTLTFTFNAGTKGGNFSTTGTPEGADLVWPASGTWTFDGDGTTSITRSDNVTMDVSANATSMTLKFNIVDPNGRILSLTGDWVFNTNF